MYGNENSLILQGYICHLVQSLIKINQIWNMALSLILKFFISDFAPKAYWISYTLEDGSRCKFNNSYFHGPCILCSTQTKHRYAALARTVLRIKLNFNDRKQFVSTNRFSPVLVCTRVARVCVNVRACVCVRA